MPKGVVTTVAYAPPDGTDQLEIVNHYVGRLRPEWSPEIERSLAGAAGTTTERSYRVTFTRGDAAEEVLEGSIQPQERPASHDHAVGENPRLLFG